MFTNLIKVIKTSVSTSALTIILPILFFSLLFIGSKFSKKNEYNEDFLSKDQTKIIKGFCAIGIILHHLAQETAAPWLESKYIIHGLDFFVNIGYLFVGVFLFISGYGLYKSYKKNDQYFEHYFARRILPIIVAYIITSLVYYLYNPIGSTYTWYVFACLICYILFYLGFMCFKKEIISFLIVIGGIVLYSLYCAYMLLGGWWYNTIGLFVVGLIFAKYDSKIVSFFKKAYLPLLIIALVGTCLGTWYGRYYEEIVYGITKESVYDLYSFYIILFRFLAANCFTLGILLISLKCKFNNKVLAFYGSISLEFYLIQGLFVQAFSYCYFDIVFKPIYYIKNIPLYIVVVLACATLAGFILNFIDKKVCQFLVYFAERRKEEIKTVKKAVKILFVVIISCLVVYIAGISIKSAIDNKGADEAIEKYINDYISYAYVGDKKVAAYIVGEGDNTLVFMRGNDDPCPSISLRYLANELSSDYKIVVLDYLGTGFSDKPSSERTTSNIVYEIHEALKGFGIKEKYILVPEYISGIYAQEYVKQYKNEVKGVITLETELYSERKLTSDNYGISQIEYHKHLKIEDNFKFLVASLCRIINVDDLVWPVFYDFYHRSVEDDEIIVAKNIVMKNIYNSTFLNENKHEFENLYNSKNLQYPRQTYVYDVLDNMDKAKVTRMAQSPEELHARICFDRSKHKSKVVNSMYKAIFIGPGILKDIIDEAVEMMH